MRISFSEWRRRRGARRYARDIGLNRPISDRIRPRGWAEIESKNCRDRAVAAALNAVMTGGVGITFLLLSISQWVHWSTPERVGFSIVTIVFLGLTPAWIANARTFRRLSRKWLTL